MTITRQNLLALLSIAVIVLCGWFAYAPALGGALLFDDVSNLGGLARIEDPLSALIFVFSGHAGPLGRPLSLATFVPQAEAWGGSPEPFLTVNILIHLLNACLVAWVLHRLTILIGLPAKNRLFVALSAAAIWLFMPLLASASLMVVQRMTTLSAALVLLALAGYLHARGAIDRRPARSLIAMSTCLVAGTVLAMLAKENGALLPTYVLVLEATLLVRPEGISQPRWRQWKTVFLLMPTFLILAYLVYRMPYSAELVLRRDFTAWQRLLTESRILWEYIFNAFVPQPGQFGPFHDGYPPARTLLHPVTLLAVSSWVTALALALRWRRRYPLISFAVLWFLAGHLLESTVLSLELYFEHRNYLPIVGPVFALCAGLSRIPAPRQKFAYAGVTAYIAVNALVLFSYTTLWGNPAAAARYWQEHFPDSVRAASTATLYEPSAEGLPGTLVGLHRLAEEYPGAGFVKIPELSLSCISAPQADHSAIVDGLRGKLKDASFNYTVAAMLSELFTTVTRTECNGVDGTTVRSLAEALLSNQRYRNDRKYNQLHHQLIARIHRHEGRYEQAIRHLETAIDYQPSADLNMMVVTTYVDAKNLDAARTFIEEARQKAPWQPMKRFVWSSRLDILSRYLNAHTSP